MYKFESLQKDETRATWLIPRKPTENLELLFVVRYICNQSGKK